jgi:hypothetical protein
VPELGRHAAIVAAGMLAGCSAAGCGTARPKRGVSRAQFIASADAVCRHEQGQLGVIAAWARSSRRTLSARRVIHGQVAQSRAATSLLEALAEPPGDESAIKRWLTARTVAATVAIDLAEAPTKRDAVAVADVRRELATTRARARSLAASYGSRVCGETD